MRTYLEHEELWECLEPAAGATVDGKKDTKAKAKIILSIDPLNYPHVESAKTAREAWNNLKQAFEDTGLTRKVGLLRNLICTRLENCDSVDEYVHKIISTSHQLRNINFNISDEWVGTLLLAGLPDSYRPMIMGIESSGVNISGDSIKVKLLQEVKDPDHANTEGSALLAKKQFHKNRKQGPRCFECNKYGHLAKNCYKRRARSESVSAGNNANTQGRDTARKALLTTILSTGKVDPKEWYIDSGASVHITNSKANMIDETSANKCEEVITADNTRLSVAGSGNVELKVQAAGEEDFVTIRDAMYVPSIATNLLSVSKMTEKGHTVMFHRNECHVYDRNGDTIATAQLVNGMYKLDRPRTLENVNMISTNKLTLWHQRFGHPCNDVLKQIGELTEDLCFTESDHFKCVSCVKGKQKRFPFKTDSLSERHTRKRLELIHSDLCQ